MSRIPQRTRNVTKHGTQYPAVVVDSFGSRASARLSNNGAIVHNLGVVGGPVQIGDLVHVDYTTPEPTIIAISKEWATMDDLLRALKKVNVPPTSQPITEMDKIAVFCLEEPSKYELFAADYYGWQDAQIHIYDDFWELGYWREWAIRLPPAGVRTPIEWTLRGLGVWVPCHIFGDPWALMDMGELDISVVGVSFENIFFHNQGQSSSGIIGCIYGGALYHAEYDENPPYEGIPTPLGDRVLFRNCHFLSYAETPSEVIPTQDPDGLRWMDYILWMLHERDAGDNDPDAEIIFDGCKIFIRDGWSGRLIHHSHVDWEDLPWVPWYAEPTFDTFWFINCEVDALGSDYGGDSPFDDGAGITDSYEVFSVGTIYKHATDLEGFTNCTFITNNDRAVIGHDHSGIPLSNTFHVDIDGEF